ncbi:lipopolysaccharide biosynthesis protein [Pseudorhodoferax sp. LjRoot39]|uniref:lipopolysaccharide biosynthesis protein n=1 Tax=Pseudorhodoferax sp. LjRoot39 TaxID=3342328 RepID=UPI003ED0959F
MNDIKHRLVKGTAWLSLARVIINALSILSTFVLARLLAPEDFGLVALGTTLMLLVTEVTELSLAQALVRHADPTREHFDTAWTLNALRGTVLGALFLAGATPAAQLYGDPRLVGIMLALGSSIFLSGLINPRRVLLTRQLVFWQEFVLNVGQKLAGVAASILVAYLYQSYWALVVGIVVTQLANVAISYMVLPFLPRVRFAHARELFSFSLWITAARFVDTLNWRFDQLFVGKLLGSTALGHYSMGSTLASIPTRETTGPLRQTFFPAFASMQNDDARMAAAYQRAQAVVTAVALPAGIGAALLADPLIRLVMGEKWVPAIAIVQALAAVYALQTLGSSADSVGMAKGQTRLLFMRSLQMLLVRVPLIVVATLYFGMAGLVLSRVFTGLLAALVNMFVVRQLIGVGVLAQFGANRRALTGAAVMVVVTLGVIHLLPAANGAHDLSMHLLVIGSSAVASYCLSTWLMWIGARKPAGPEQELKQLLGKVLGKLRRKVS